MAQRDILFLALLILATLAVFANGLTGEFLFDDRPYITDNPQVVGEASIFDSETPPGRPELGLYRPVFILTLRLNYLMNGLKPSLFHGTNLLIHLLGTIALFFLIRRLNSDGPAAFLGALLFAVHPAHVEAVTWIVGRAELLAFLFCMLLALCHFAAEKRPVLRIGEGVFFLLAALSKENALAFPLVLLLLQWFAGERPSNDRLKNLLKSFLLYIPLIAAVLALRYAVIGRLHPAIETAPFKEVGLLGRVEAALASFAEYLRLFVFPYPLKIFYHISEVRHLTVFRAGILAGFSALVFLAIRKRHPSAGWLLWIPAALLPVLNLVPIGAAFNERFFYLPSAGACAAFGLLLASLIRKEKARRGTHNAVWVPAGALLLFGALTLARNPVFENSFSLWKDGVNKGGAFAFPHYNLGEAYYEKGLFEYQSPETWGAVAELRESLRLHPDHPYAFAAHYRLGQYYFEERYLKKTRDPGDLETAIYHLKKSVTIGPAVKEKWKPALALAVISTEPGAGKFLSPEQARKSLELAVELGAPIRSAARVRNRLQATPEEREREKE